MRGAAFIGCAAIIGPGLAGMGGHTRHREASGSDTRYRGRSMIDRERIVLCKKGPPEAVDQALLVTSGPSRVETVGTLAEAMSLCLSDQIDRLIVNMFSFTSSELTSLMLFREMRPAQRVMFLCPEEAVMMLMTAGLADECHPIAPAGPSRAP